ncbi:MAG: hypothetical protein KC731_22760 [Myxococcales bacterium]|nr:hypothetical protein [Myxococcales bacterium]
MPTKREKRLHMLLSDDEWGMLVTFCEEYDMTFSAVIRSLLRRAYEDHFEASTAKPKGPKKRRWVP